MINKKLLDHDSVIDTNTWESQGRKDISRWFYNTVGVFRCTHFINHNSSTIRVEYKT